MKNEIIKYDDSEVIIIDDAVIADKRINIYFDCCMLSYSISNSSVNDAQGIADKRLRSDLDHEHPIIENLLEEGSGSLNVIPMNPRSSPSYRFTIALKFDIKKSESSQDISKEYEVEDIMLM